METVICDPVDDRHLRQTTWYFSTQRGAIAAQQTLSLIQRLQLSTVALD
ncbi:hypothetical protein H6F93_03645 [Leptolyngbya sp. FACHB-671]|nr:MULTISPECIES: hypothetical protein [unclassified Leptolyngbya]MBD1999546.1 hypothetical protein [Leptolyngbya sp. FACHB-541]MBD2066624.1 hypothetical protein [Leptolyngbya sp. FACHB-671]